MKKIFIALLTLALTGCTATVTDKYHVPEFDRDHEECFQSGRTGCLDSKNMRVKVPECWRLEIDDFWDTTHICVSEETWKNTQIGYEWTDETYPI